jgi:hypothetical protein
VGERFLRAVSASLLVLCFAAGCESPPAFPVPDGPARHVVVDARLAVYVTGTWVVDAYLGELEIELKKYRIRMDPPEKGHGSEPVVRIDIGSIAPRTWQAVTVYYEDEMVGRVPIPDGTFSTLQFSAGPAAAFIARRVWKDALQGRSLY